MAAVSAGFPWRVKNEQYKLYFFYQTHERHCQLVATELIDVQYITKPLSKSVVSKLPVKPGLYSIEIAPEFQDCSVQCNSMQFSVQFYNIKDIGIP